MKKGMTKVIIAASIVALLLVVVLIYYFGAFYPKFNKVAAKEFPIPGLSEGFVPQGLDYIEEEGVFLVSGYMADGSASRIYLVDKESGETKMYVTLKNVDGTAYNGHAGGIVHLGDSLWVVGDKLLNHVKLSSIFSAESGTSASITASKETGNGCDFVSIINGKLLVGEFHKKGKYDTPLEHHIELGDGETNYAMCYLYDVYENEPLGVKENAIGALSIPSQVQGLCLNKEGKIILSTSYSIPSSKILTYENVLDCETDKTLKINGEEVPLYVLDNTKFISSLKGPSMSEEVVLVDGRVYVLFESACTKYKMVNRTRTKNVYSLNI